MSKLIKLTQDQYALVDDEDYDYLNQFKWCADWCRSTNSFYAKRRRLKREPIGPSIIMMHRYIMSAPAKMYIDHINHDTLDNRKCNLRICTASQNAMNRNKQSTNTSGYKGVCWSKSAKKWLARIDINKKSIHLGYFKEKEEAYKVYCEAAKKHHGKFMPNDNMNKIKGLEG